MATRHRQVPLLWFTCDEELAELIKLMNECRIVTVNSCQDAEARRGDVRRVWVEIFPEAVLPFLAMLDKPEETGDRESLSNRIAFDWEPDDWEAFRENRSWHYTAAVDREPDRDELVLKIGIRFPYTDLAEVVAPAADGRPGDRRPHAGRRAGARLSVASPA